MSAKRLEHSSWYDAAVRASFVVIGLLVVGCDDGSGDIVDPDASELPSLPRTDYCDPARNVPDELLDRELEVLDLVNDLRASGFACPERGFIGPAPALRMAGGPWCAARVHVRDMAEQDYFDHEDPDGALAWDRLRSTEYAFVLADEVIAAGELEPSAIVEEIWMTRPGSCAALMAPEYSHVGIGTARAPDAEPDAEPDDEPALMTFWTAVLSVPSPR